MMPVLVEPPLLNIGLFKVIDINFLFCLQKFYRIYPLLLNLLLKLASKDLLLLLLLQVLG
jgi:hypothetical protein